MHRARSIITGTIASLLLLSHAQPTFAISPIFISEIGTEDRDGDTDADFIELSNPGSAPLPLTDVNLIRRTKTGKTDSSLRSSFATGDAIPAGGHYLLVNPKAPDYLLSCADKTFVSGGTLTADNSLALTDDSKNLLDSFAYGSGHTAPLAPSLIGNPAPGESIVRATATDTPALTAAPHPTNAAGTICAPPEKPLPPAGKPGSVIISEILPNTGEKNDAGEYIELLNIGTDDAELAGWTLRDSSKTGKYVFPNESRLAPGAFLCLTRGADFSFALNNTSETVTLTDALGNTIDSFAYAGGSREGVSFVATASGVRATKTPTKCAPNTTNNLPETKERIPKNIYKGVRTEFFAKGKDADKEKLKYVWDFGDDHKSYKADTSHVYEESGSYVITLTTDDGVEKVTETFPRDVKTYPHLELRIVRFAPNPAGRDTDAEWVEIENREKKPVTLTGYSIATGTKRKRLVNHPIRTAPIAPAKGRVIVTRADSALTLPNKAGIVELRAPDGEVLHDLKYKEEKSIPDDAVFEKKKGEKWKLTVAAKPEMPTVTEPADTEPAPAPAEELSTPVAPVPDEAELIKDETLSRKATAYRMLLAAGTDLALTDAPIVPTTPLIDADLREPQPHYVTTFLHEVGEKTNLLLGEMWR